MLRSRLASIAKVLGAFYTSGMDNKIHVVITGGTIDSVWDGKQDTIVVAEQSIVPEYLKAVKLYDELEFSQVCMKDSRALTAEDRAKILETIENSAATKVIVTHGTYTMPDTAKFIEANLKRKDQVIIFTGSMTPLKGFEFSDAPFNLGYTLAKVQELKPGVYLVMNGRTFTQDEVIKDLSEGKFSSIFLDQQ